MSVPDFKKRGLCLLLTLALLLALPITASADTVYHTMLENLPLSVDGGEAVTVRTLHNGYPNNRFVSLRDFAAALANTSRRFNVTINGTSVALTTGADYIPVGGEGYPFPETNARTGAPYVYATEPLAPYYLELDGRQLRYLSFLGSNANSRPDCFLSLTDLAMQLDLDLTVSSAGITLNTAGRYTVDLEALREEGFFYEVHSALVGDADTGEIFAAFEPELPVPIASTTKLMSFLVVMDAVTDGRITLSDTVTITEEAERLSKTPDGAVPLQAGEKTNVTELLCGMLLPSSNECSLALAIYTAGSEEAFVEQMNRKARALGLSDGAVFYNCHGLPVYTDNLPATKIQNRMSALDMFTLVRHILRTYPDITRITSLKSVTLETLGITASNSNPMVYNLPGAVGLKTGTTNMSGACLVSAVQAPDAQGQTHTVVAVEFGAEDSGARTTLSEELLRYGMQRLREGDVQGAEAPAMPETAEEFIQAVLGSF